MEGYEIYRLSDEEIQHVGVKGMKWGKRKSRSAYMTRRTAKAEKKLAKKDEKWEKKQNPYAMAAETHNRALPKMTKFLSELDKKYKNANFDDENDAEAKKYFKEFENEYKKQLNSALNSSPDSVSPSGKKKAQAVMLDYGSFKIEIVDNK